MPELAKAELRELDAEMKNEINRDKWTKVQFNPGYEADGTEAEFQGWDYYQEVYLVSASGRVLIVRVATAVYHFGADCAFSLLVITS